MIDPDDINHDARELHDYIIAFTDNITSHPSLDLFHPLERRVLLSALRDLRDVAGDMDATHNPDPSEYDGPDTVAEARGER